LTYRSSKSVNRGDLQARWRNEKKRKESHKQWYFTHAPRPPTWTDCSHIWKLRWGRRRSYSFQVSCRSVQGFCCQGWSKFPLFLYLGHWLIQQVWATAQPVIIISLHQADKKFSLSLWHKEHSEPYSPVYSKCYSYIPHIGTTVNDANRGSWVTLGDSFV